jgi:tetratricopeptide (TPR) repeat protein
VRLALVLAILLCGCGHRKKPAPSTDDALRSLMTALRPEVAKWPRIFDRDEGPRLDAIARPAGALAARAIHELLLERYSGGVRSVMRVLSHRDEEVDRPAWLMGELADEALRATLAASLGRDDLHPDLRRRFAIALCRKGNETLLETLVDRAVDRREDHDIRRAILERLHRVEAVPPPRLREALYLPFHGLDRLAAGALARMGDAEAPSLVLEGLDKSDRRVLMPAVPRLTGQEFPEPDGSVVSEYDRRIRADALRKWVETNRPETGFEAERRRYLASAQRKRELALASFDDIIAAGDDFDLASAVFFATGDEDREANLERLNRIALLVQRRIEGIPDPESRIAAVNECLLPSVETCDLLAVESGQRSRLDYVLAHDAGTCVGWSCLYLAVGERCGLPLRPVRAPGHMFVRYDDGTFRRNIETTSLGKAKPDDSYREGDVGPTELTRRQVVADALNSVACTAAYYDRYDEARDLVAKALALDPDFGLACLNRAKFTFHSRLDADESVIADIEMALSLHSDAAGCRRAAGDLLVALGRVERALELYTEADAIEPSSDAKAGRADCLSLLGRIDEAKSAAGDEMPLFLSVRLAPDQVHSAVVAAGSSVDTCYRVACELLELQPPRHAEALKIVDQGLGELEEREGALPNRPEWVAENRMRRNLLALRAKALAGLTRYHDARVALENAAKLKGSNRLLLEARAYVERLAAPPTGR